VYEDKDALGPALPSDALSSAEECELKAFAIYKQPHAIPPVSELTVWERKIVKHMPPPLPSSPLQPLSI
jgi:hypothetical protein